MLSDAKIRARRLGREFDITINDIVIPDVCPLLGVIIKRGKGKVCGNSPSLDKIDNSKGYTKDNIMVISHIANQMKGACTLGELKLFAERLLIYIDNR